MKPEPESIRKILSNNIKKYRRNFEYTQEKFAEKAGISTQMLNDIEGCRRWVSSRTLTKLAKTLNISEFELLIPNNDMEKTEKRHKFSLKSLNSLQKSIIKSISAQFEKAKDSGNFI